MTDRIGCARAMATLQRGLDGELLAPDELARLGRHRAACARCEARAQELDAVQYALREVEAPVFPETALHAVFRQTSRAPSARVARRARVGAAMRVAVAALVAGLGLVLWLVTWSPAGPSPAELAQAAAETRMVLGLTATALRGTERAAVRQVLGARVAPALRKLPVRWPEVTTSSGDDRRSGT